MQQFDAAAAGWLLWLEHNGGRSRRTVDKYAGYLDRLRAWCTAPPQDPRMRPSCADPLALTRDDLDRFAGVYAHALGVCPRSRRPLVAAVRGFYAWAASKQLVAVNAAADLRYPRFGAPLPQAIGLVEAQRMLMTPDIETLLGVRDAAIIATLVGCGLRVSGVCALNESSLLWERAEGGGEDLTIMVTEKGKKDRLIPAPHETALLIRAYLGHQELESIDRQIDGDKVLFVTTRNRSVPAHEYHGEARRITPGAVADLLDRVGEKAGVPRDRRNPHAFRHLYGTEMTEGDVVTLALQALMGHANPKDTEIYTRLARRKLREAVDRANPLAKMRGPLLDSLRAIGGQQRRARAPSSPPRGHDNRHTASHHDPEA